MIYALIPAAGKSTRMGTPKLALPLGDRSILEHVIADLRLAGIGQILVVVGPHVPELVALGEKAGARGWLLDRETPDMRTTVELGLRRLEELFHPTIDDLWLLLPADHPTLEPEIVQQLIEAYHKNPGRSIVLPTYQGKRGHPALLSWKHAAKIAAFPPNLGVNAYLREAQVETLELPVSTAEVLCDLDTPADYERLRTRWHECKDP